MKYKENIPTSYEAKCKLWWTVKIKERLDELNLFLGLFYNFDPRNFPIWGVLWSLENQRKLALEWCSSIEQKRVPREKCGTKKMHRQPWYKKLFTSGSSGLLLIRPDTEANAQLSHGYAHPFLHETCILERKALRGRQALNKAAAGSAFKVSQTCSFVLLRLFVSQIRNVSVTIHLLSVLD